VLRITDLLIENSDDDSRRVHGIREYHADVMHELVWIDDLVSGCYSHLHEFRKFAAFSMCYFAAATTFERRFLEGESSTGFLCCNDQLLRANVRALTKRDPSESAEHFENACQTAIAPFNHVGLFSPEITNMYAYTALPE
jgi:FADH2 O2-dependent halogenase